MSHKAYAFDWPRFQADELHTLLPASLKSVETAPLVRYVEANLETIKDPYEGLPIGATWQAMLENQDVNEYGDFALTRFYEPAQDRGIAEGWVTVDATFEPGNRTAFLGFQLGEPGAWFDPGRQGSYFQSPSDVVESLRRLKGLPQADEFQEYLELLSDCANQRLGLYVTF